MADDLRAADARIGDITPFGPGVGTGLATGPALIFGDTAEIPLMAAHSAKRFDYRMGWLAAPGDVVVIGGPRYPAFETYQRRWLSADDITYLNVDPRCAAPRRATPVICLRDRRVFRRLCAALPHHGEITLHAHIATGTIWALASQLHRHSGARIHVAGPPPLMSRRANDKLWFGQIAGRLLGSRATPPKRAAHSVSALTRHVADMARKWDRLVIKVPDSAGSAGNFMVRSDDARRLNARTLGQRLRDAVSGTARKPRFPMLVEVWDADVLTSPSVQVWIPGPADGPPVIEGVFEQVLSGETAAFSGAQEAELPGQTDDALCHGALQIAFLFQRLGYFGRCSFDAIVTGPGRSAADVHWIECNARWGGVSVPMSLANRLTYPAPPPHYAIVQNDSEKFRPLSFGAAETAFADAAPGADYRSGTLFLSPNLMASGAGCHFLSFGTDRRSAALHARDMLRRLRQPSHGPGGPEF